MMHDATNIKYGVIYQKTITFIHTLVSTWSHCNENPYIWLENTIYENPDTVRKKREEITQLRRL